MHFETLMVSVQVLRTERGVRMENVERILTFVLLVVAFAL